jgi:ribosome maturation factor RimP
MREALLRLLEPVVDRAGFELVELEFSPASRRALLRVYIDRRDGEPVTLDDCERASRAMEAVLDSADPIGREYELEVSSPGFDRPLRTPGHFARFVGSEVRIELQRPLEGRKRFRGRLLSAGPEAVVVEVDGREWRLPMADMGKARLVG